MLWGRSWLQGQDGGSLGKVVPLGRKLAAGSFPALAVAPGSVDGSGNKAVGPAALEWERGGVTALLAKSVKNSYGLKAQARLAGSPGGWRALSSDVGSLSEIKVGHHCLDFPETQLYMQCSYTVKEVHKS